MALPGGHGNTSLMLTLLLSLLLNFCDVGYSTILHSNRLLASKIRDAPLTAGTNSENTQTVAASSRANSENVPAVTSVPIEGCLKLFNTGNIPLDDADVHSLKMAVSFTFDVPLEEIKLTPVGPAVVATSLLIQTKSEERVLGSDDDDDNDDEDCSDDAPTREKEEEDFADEAEFKKISNGNRFDAVRKLPIILPLAMDVEENALPLPQVASAAETASALAAAAAVTAAPQVATHVVAVAAATTAAPVAATVVPATATAAPVALAATVAPAVVAAAPAAVAAAPAPVTAAPAPVTAAPAPVTVAPAAVAAAPVTVAPDAMPTETIQFKLPGGQKNADRQDQLARNPVDLFQMFSTVGLSSMLSVQVVQQC